MLSYYRCCHILFYISCHTVDVVILCSALVSYCRCILDLYWSDDEAKDLHRSRNSFSLTENIPNMPDLSRKSKMLTFFLTLFFANLYINRVLHVQICMLTTFHLYNFYDNKLIYTVSYVDKVSTTLYSMS